ncbi:hypothetical protein [Sphingomonas sp. RB1R13]|uniref:hypothetical protein n=1 Tax=Sphingomonas sp. RB1R13 TaxID=3096159 RepID=UPI002FCBBD99
MTDVVLRGAFSKVSRRWQPGLVEPIKKAPGRSARLFLPLEYTAKIKRPDEHYILHGVVGYDLLVTALAYAPISPRPALVVACLGLYIMAFFATYEIGYFENDKVAAKLERLPIVHPAFVEQSYRFSPALGWISGLMFGAAGAALQGAAQLSGPFFDSDASRLATFGSNWALVTGLQLVTRLIFYAFNHSTPDSRLTSMMMMQLARVFGYALLFKISLVGGILCLAHAVARWTAYVVYRSGGNRQRLPLHLVTFLLFFSVGAALLASGVRITVDQAGQVILIILYLSARALRNMMQRLD